ncbi:MAG: hypothetical protein IKZ87_00585 [Actinomycetaceae bacterium]|nr:hypothetical protein [Actinomycetaceae bacterium]
MAGTVVCPYVRSCDDGAGARRLLYMRSAVRAATRSCRSAQSCRLNHFVVAAAEIERCEDTPSKHKKSALPPKQERRLAPLGQAHRLTRARRSQQPEAT